MSAPALAGVGVLLGVAAGFVLLRRSAAARADGLFQAWRAEESRRVATEAADAARLGVKSRLAGPVAMPSLAADGRWLGDPVHLVVFDGDSEVKAGTVDELHAITFVVVGGDRCAEADVVAECVAAGRVRWATLRLAEPQPAGEG